MQHRKITYKTLVHNKIHEKTQLLFCSLQNLQISQQVVHLKAFFIYKQNQLIEILVQLLDLNQGVIGKTPINNLKSLLLEYNNTNNQINEISLVIKSNISNKGNEEIQEIYLMNFLGYINQVLEINYSYENRLSKINIDATILQKIIANNNHLKNEVSMGIKVGQVIDTFETFQKVINIMLIHQKVLLDHCVLNFQNGLKRLQDMVISGQGQFNQQIKSVLAIKITQQMSSSPSSPIKISYRGDQTLKLSLQHRFINSSDKFTSESVKRLIRPQSAYVSPNKNKVKNCFEKNYPQVSINQNILQKYSTKKSLKFYRPSTSKINQSIKLKTTNIQQIFKRLATPKVLAKEIIKVPLDPKQKLLLELYSSNNRIQQSIEGYNQRFKKWAQIKFSNLQVDFECEIDVNWYNFKNSNDIRLNQLIYFDETVIY